MLVSCKQSVFFSDDQGSTGLIYSPISTYLELLDKNLYTRGFCAV